MTTDDVAHSEPTGPEGMIADSEYRMDGPMWAGNTMRMAVVAERRLLFAGSE